MLGLTTMATNDPDLRRGLVESQADSLEGAREEERARRGALKGARERQREEERRMRSRLLLRSVVTCSDE